MSHHRLARPPGYAALALAAIDDTPAPELVAERPAIVLESIARGAGATRWYRLASPLHLPELAERLAPGSLVSFYFDGRISEGDPTAVPDEIMAIIERDGDAVVAAFTGDMELRKDYVASPNDLADFVAELGPSDTFLFGRYPRADNDGKDAVTLVLPDSDGVVRQHPY